jgi:ubiquinone/menaquinone biosynthesis C-methylase UbiE
MSQPPPAPPANPGPPVDPTARVTALFDRVADTYETVGVPWFAPIAQGLVEAVAPAPGERVVDVGCGRGAALLPVAAAVGPSGRVVGVDISVRMIELLDREVAAAGLANVELHVMDASAPELPRGGSDAVLASLVLFFLPQPQAALRAWAALLRPGGRLGISTFGDRDDAWKRLDAVFDPYLPPQMLDARTSGATGPFSSDEGVESLFTGAGLVDVVTTRAEVEVAFPDVGAWSTWTRSHGQRAMWDHVPDTHQASVATAAAAILDGARGDDGVARLRQQVRYTLGWAPPRPT